MKTVGELCCSSLYLTDKRFYLYPLGHTVPFLSRIVFPGYVKASWLCWLFASETFRLFYPCIQLQNIVNATICGNEQLVAVDVKQGDSSTHQLVLNYPSQTMLTGLHTLLLSFSISTILYGKGRSPLAVHLHHPWGCCPRPMALREINLHSENNLLIIALRA